MKLLIFFIFFLFVKLNLFCQISEVEYLAGNYNFTLSNLDESKKKKKKTGKVEIFATAKSYSYYLGMALRKRAILIELDELISKELLTIPDEVPFVGGEKIHFGTVTAEAEKNHKFSTMSGYSVNFFGLLEGRYRKMAGEFSPQLPSESPDVVTRIWTKENLLRLAVDEALVAPRQITAQEISVVVRPLDLFLKADKDMEKNFQFFFSPYTGVVASWDPSVLRFDDLVGEQGLKKVIQNEVGNVPGANQLVGKIYDLMFPNPPIIDPLYRGWTVGCDLGLSGRIGICNVVLDCSPEYKSLRHLRDHKIQYSVWNLPISVKIGIGLNWLKK